MYCMEILHISSLTRDKVTKKDPNSHLLQLLVKVAGSLVEANNTRNSHATALQIRHTSRDPVGAHANSREAVHSSLGAQVVDLRRRGIQFEKGVVNGPRYGLGERVHRPLATVDGGHGGGDNGCPFLVGVAICRGHCCFVWRGCC